MRLTGKAAQGTLGRQNEAARPLRALASQASSVSRSNATACLVTTSRRLAPGGLMSA